MRKFAICLLISAASSLQSGCATKLKEAATFLDLYTVVRPTTNDIKVMSDQMVEPTLANNVDYEKGNRGLFCDVYRPVHPTSNDVVVVSDQLVTATLSNNSTYERLRCGS